MTPEQRSNAMRRNRGDDLKPERRMRAALEPSLSAAKGVRMWAWNAPGLPGKPDVVLWPTGGGTPLCVFVHGCFWHCCPRHWKAPKSGQKAGAEGWAKKFEANRRRDRRVRRRLRAAGYRTMVVWEHDLRSDGAAAAAAKRVINRLKRYEH